MPALPLALIEPLSAQIVALLPERPDLDPAHPLECHRCRIRDPILFAHVVAALVHGSGHASIASPGCSDRTVRRQVRTRATEGRSHWLHALVLAHYDRLIGLDLRHVGGNGSITKAHGGVRSAARRRLSFASSSRQAPSSPSTSCAPPAMTLAGPPAPRAAACSAPASGRF